MDKPISDDFDEAALFSPQAVRTAAPPAPPAPPANPLAKYFRMPGLHVPLPTRGAFLPPGSFEPDLNGNIQVFPMRAADELLLRSPDALMSGYAIEKLIESCVPAIKFPKLLSVPDLEVLLLAIRAASYGSNQSIDVTCSKCQQEGTHVMSLTALLGDMKPIPAPITVRLADDLVASLRPYSMAIATHIAMATFEEGRKLQALEDADSAAQTRQRNDSYQRMINLKLGMMAECVIELATPEGVIADRAMIREFMGQVPPMFHNAIEAKLEEINKLGIDKTIALTCQCGHTWETEVEFNPANFFEPGSST